MKKGTGRNQEEIKTALSLLFIAGNKKQYWINAFSIPSLFSSLFSFFSLPSPLPICFIYALKKRASYLFVLCLERASKEEDVRLGLVNGIMDPPIRLLDTKATPFVFGQKLSGWELLRDGLGKDHVSVLVDIVVVLFRVVDLVGHLLNLFSFLCVCCVAMRIPFFIL